MVGAAASGSQVDKPDQLMALVIPATPRRPQRPKSLHDDGASDNDTDDDYDDLPIGGTAAVRPTWTLEGNSEGQCYFKGCKTAAPLPTKRNNCVKMPEGVVGFDCSELRMCSVHRQALKATHPVLEIQGTQHRACLKHKKIELLAWFVEPWSMCRQCHDNKATIAKIDFTTEQIDTLMSQHVEGIPITVSLILNIPKARHKFLQPLTLWYHCGDQVLELVIPDEAVRETVNTRAKRTTVTTVADIAHGQGLAFWKFFSMLPPGQSFFVDIKTAATNQTERVKKHVQMNCVLLVTSPSSPTTAAIAQPAPASVTPRSMSTSPQFASPTESASGTKRGAPDSPAGASGSPTCKQRLHEVLPVVTFVTEAESSDDDPSEAQGQSTMTHVQLGLVVHPPNLEHQCL